MGFFLDRLLNNEKLYKIIEVEYVPDDIFSNNNKPQKKIRFEKIDKEEKDNDWYQ